jgi:hypothetical protein
MTTGLLFGPLDGWTSSPWKAERRGILPGWVRCDQCHRRVRHYYDAYPSDPRHMNFLYLCSPCMVEYLTMTMEEKAKAAS